MIAHTSCLCPSDGSGSSLCPPAAQKSTVAALHLHTNENVGPHTRSPALTSRTRFSMATAAFTVTGSCLYSLLTTARARMISHPLRSCSMRNISRCAKPDIPVDDAWRECDRSHLLLYCRNQDALHPVCRLFPECCLLWLRLQCSHG